MELELLYEGKAKKVYQSDTNENHLILSYKNAATAFNGEKKAQFTGKGRLNNEISSSYSRHYKIKEFSRILSNGWILLLKWFRKQILFR